jgi:hypothetical protein
MITAIVLGSSSHAHKVEARAIRSSSVPSPQVRIEGVRGNPELGLYQIFPTRAPHSLTFGVIPDLSNEVSALLYVRRDGRQRPTD